MPVTAPSWTEFLICPICTNEFAANLRAPITLKCGHSICKKCLVTIQHCPYDQVSEEFAYITIMAENTRNDMFRAIQARQHVKKEKRLREVVKLSR